MTRGTLVADDVVVALVSRRVAEDDTRDGFVLDGFPRTIQQAEDVDAGLAELGRRLTAALSLTLADDEVVARLAGRRTCARCGRTYHVDFDPPRDRERCDVDGQELVRRQDDDPATIKQRLDVYHDQSEPLIAYYRRSRLLREVDARGSADAVHARLRAALGR
jgi:adenylate kinase